MRKLLDYLLVLLILLATNGLIYAQDFTVEIESTDDCAGYIKPLKAGETHEFQVNVTNNREDTCTLETID